MTASHGQLIVISGPSGVGKTTIAHAVRDALDAAFSVSMTTRPKTPADTEGVDYHFVDHDRFRRAIADDELLEYAQVFDNYYGTPRKPVEDHLAAGRDVILEIDVNGGEQVRRKRPDALMLFIMPPSEQTLLDRLRARGREDEQRIQRRFSEAKREIAQAQRCGAYDHFIVNDNLDRAIAQAIDIVKRRAEARP